MPKFQGSRQVGLRRSLPFFFFFSLSPWFASSLIIMIMIIIKTMTIVSNMND